MPLAVAPIFLLRDLGPLPGTSLDHTVWRKGMRLLVYGTGTADHAGGIQLAGRHRQCRARGLPERRRRDGQGRGHHHQVPAGHELDSAPTKVRNWTVDDIVAYSKICTHVGCPAALYEQTTHHILCPCHQSTFDAARGARVIFGPATRPLPQLPIERGRRGFLVAHERFPRAGGPELLGAVMSVDRAL